MKLNTNFEYIPTAGDIDLEPELPVGDGVGRIAIEFGAFDAGPASLLFWPIGSG